MSRSRVTAAERFNRFVNRDGPVPSERPALGKCWQWTGGLTKRGYGGFHPVRIETVLAHRWAYEHAVGAIPVGLVLDHLCRNRQCVNPAHLEAITNAENLRRGSGYRLRNGMDSACIHGHTYTPENTYTNPNDPNDIRCRECARIRDRKRAA